MPVTSETEDFAKGSMGVQWKRALNLAEPLPLPVTQSGIPVAPGVYIWFRDGYPIYVGRAIGKKGLRQRLRAHLAQGPDLSRSTLRASVAVSQINVSRSIARRRPSIMTAQQIALVNDWIAECQLGWIACDTRPEALILEKNLRDEWLPELNLV
uniref:GIY-YIG nuclease family protein n=1 Tax=Paenarthrobacter ureafaciens TaxID=37931 RepID=UPI003F490F93